MVTANKGDIHGYIGGRCMWIARIRRRWMETANSESDWKDGSTGRCCEDYLLSQVLSSSLWCVVAGALLLRIFG